MGREALERDALGSLILSPVLQEGEPELNAGLFDGRFRQVFEGITAIWEEGRPKEINEVILANRIKGGCPVHYITALTDGRQRVSPAAFHDIVHELQLDKSYQRAMHEAEGAVKQYMANGLRDLSVLNAAVAEYHRIERTGEPLAVKFSTIEARPISWLWPGWLPGGMFSLAVGNSGIGKSFFSIDLAARLSCGKPFPDGSELRGGPCETLFITAEDPKHQALRPRLDACGADVDKVHHYQRPSFCITEIGLLQSYRQQYPGIQLIVLDPLTAFLPARTDFFKDPSVRSALGPVVTFAEETGVAVLGICHFRKAEVEAIIHKVSGSTALAAEARSIISLAEDEKDRRRRLVLPMKCSYAKRPPGLAFRIIGDPPRIEFEEAPVMETAEDVLPGREIRELASERNDAKGFLMDFLKDGPRTPSEIKEAADAAGFPMRTVYHAAERLPIAKEDKGFGSARVVTWRLGP